MHTAEIVNGKVVILCEGNLVEKGFLSLSDAEQRAAELNQANKKD